MAVALKPLAEKPPKAWAMGRLGAETHEGVWAEGVPLVGVPHAGAEQENGAHDQR